MRDKVRNFLKKMKAKASMGSGFLGAALKAAFKGLKLVAGFVVGKVADRMMQSLIRGVAKKLKALIGDEVLEELEQKVQEINALAEQIGKKATDTVDSLFEKTLGVHFKVLEKLQEVYNIFSDIVTVVNLVRWARGSSHAFRRLPSAPCGFWERQRSISRLKKSPRPAGFKRRSGRCSRKSSTLRPPCQTTWPTA